MHTLRMTVAALAMALALPVHADAQAPGAGTEPPVPTPTPAKVPATPASPAPSPPASAPAPMRYQPWAGPSDPARLRDEPSSGPRPQDRRDEVLISGRATHDGYGGPELKLSGVLSAPALLIGAQGGWIVNHSFVLGLAGYGLVTRHDVPMATRVDGERSVLGFGYGGLRTAYLFQPHRLIHGGAGLLIGAGGSVAVSRRAFETRDDDGDVDPEDRAAHGDALFVLEPHLEIELNVVHFFRVALDASYRYVGAVDAPGMNSKKLSAPAGGIAFKFGSF